VSTYFVLIGYRRSQLGRIARCNVLGNWFPILSDVRQGDVLSAVLFSIYIDDLITELKQSGHIAYIGNIYIYIHLYSHKLQPQNK